MLTLDELTIDLKEMVDDKAPKLDKFMGKFYKATWDFIGYDLLHVY